MEQDRNRREAEQRARDQADRERIDRESRERIDHESRERIERESQERIERESRERILRDMERINRENMVRVGHEMERLNRDNQERIARDMQRIDQENRDRLQRENIERLQRESMERLNRENTERLMRDMRRADQENLERMQRDAAERMAREVRKGSAREEGERMIQSSLHHTEKNNAREISRLASRMERDNEKKFSRLTRAQIQEKIDRIDQELRMLIYQFKAFTATADANAFEPGVVPARNAMSDENWVEKNITKAVLSAEPPWTYTLTYADGAILVIPLEQVHFGSTPAESVVMFRKHKFSGRIVPCVVSQSDKRLRLPQDPNKTAIEIIAGLSVARFDAETAPQIAGAVNNAQWLAFGKGFLEVLKIQAMNPQLTGEAGILGLDTDIIRAMGEVKEPLTIIEIGAGDLKASIRLAKELQKAGAKGVEIIASDPVMPEGVGGAEAIQALKAAGGKFIQATAADMPAGSADYIFWYLPFDIEGEKQLATLGTWRAVEDVAQALKPDGNATLVLLKKETAEYLLNRASKAGLRTFVTETTLDKAAPGATGAGIPNVSEATHVWMLNIYKKP